MSIGKNIRRLREEMNLTQKQFAKRIGMQDKQLCRYEVDGCVPSVRILKRIADFCEVSIDEIVYDKDKQLSKRTRINDKELLQLFRRMDKMKKTDRELYHWIISSLMNPPRTT